MKYSLVFFMICCCFGRAAAQDDIEKQLIAIYIEQHKAIDAGDIEAMKKNLASTVIDQMNAEKEDVDFFVEVLQELSPPLESIEFMGSVVSGEEAVLKAVSTTEEETSDCTISFVLEENKWKILKISWHSGID